MTVKLLALVSTVILGSESHGPHDHILLSDGSGSLPDSKLDVHIMPPEAISTMYFINSYHH
jgi:hypothetical protein